MAATGVPLVEPVPFVDGNGAKEDIIGLDPEKISSVFSLQSRLEDLEKKYQELLGNQDKTEGGKKEEKKEGGKERDKNKDKTKETKDDLEPDLDDNLPLTAKLNRISWAQWRKLRLSEEEWQNKSDEQKKKEIKTRKTKPERFVIDVVADTGDLGFHAYTEKAVSNKRLSIPCRIRINSEHVLDALDEITNVVFPRKCQILHPYKVIVDNLDGIKEYSKVLDNQLMTAKIALNAKVEEENDQKNGGELISPVEVNGANVLTEKHLTSKSKQKSPKTKEEEDLSLAQEKIAHYQCFIELLETDLAPETEVSKAIKAGTAQKLMFCHLWHLFPPGETIYYQNANGDEPPQASLVLKVSGGRARLPNSSSVYIPWFVNPKRYLQKFSPFTIDAFHLDFNGKKFRLIQTKYEISRYSGEMPITSLPVFPLRFLPGSKLASTMHLLLKRGINFRGLATVDAAHREYRGMSLDPEKEDIDGRVIIDFKQAPAITPTSGTKLTYDENEEEEKDSAGRIFGLRALSQTKDTELLEVTGRNENPDLTLYNDHSYDSDKTDKLLLENKILLAPSQELASEDLNDDELRLLPGSVYAYVLRSRKYCKCDINLVKEITLGKEAFDDLVLPKHYKTLIRSLVDRHSLGSRPVAHKSEKDRLVVQRTDSQLAPNDHDHQDTLSIVKGKGKGLIILLHGVPGVGKTSTAETIAEATGRPLLPVTCGDIGETAAEVEKKLEQIFTNSHRWGCVLLLDEAEVFLAKRNLNDLTRNAMVSVFLRVLEYYSGILFLTTNRVGTMDEAFKSRIHISLYYPPLDWKTSKSIWLVNLKRSQEKVETNKDDIIKFAKKRFHHSEESSRWNGRQIYNAFKTAIALAEFEAGDSNRDQKPVLTTSHLQQVARAAKKFDEYLLETQGGETTAATNQQRNIRADAFGIDDAPAKLKRRPTKNRMLDWEELPSTSEEDSDDNNDLSASSEEETESEDAKKSKKKSKSSSKKKSRKSKKSSKKVADDSSDSSSD